MRLRFVILTNQTVGRRTGGVEVPQGRAPPAVGGRIVGHRELDNELGPAVRVYRTLWRVLGDWYRLRGPVCGTGARKDESIDGVAAHPLEQGQCVGDVVLVVLSRI